MVIFKCLSLKAVSILQDHEGGRGRGNKNDYLNASLRLSIIIHQYIDSQSHLFHTFSLPLSLSLSSTHITHTHTHTYTEQIRQI